MNQHTDNPQVRTFAVDLAKHVFQVAGEDRVGRVLLEARHRSREAFWDWARTLRAPVQVLLETGSGAQAWARALQAQGVQVRVLPAQRVAEHRSGAKNDRNDARALLRAGRDDSIHAVPVKSPERLALQAVHRARSGYVRRRTALGNQMRGLLLEHAVVIAKSHHALDMALDRVLADASVPIPEVLRDLLADLAAEWRHLGERIAAKQAQLKALANQDPLGRRLQTVPGIGPVTASALICKELDPARFANARQLSAYFGLVPEQHSSGARIRLGRMSRRGDRAVRSLLIEGAQAVLRQLPRQPDGAQRQRLQRWLQRHGRKGAAVRLANRNLRVVWHLLREPQEAGQQEAGMA